MKLRDDLLYLVVFGPGFGESILLRTPEREWVVVDGCRMPGSGNGESPAVRLLKEQEESWSAVVLTHPHLDHAAGLDDVLSYEGSGPVGCFPHRSDIPTDWHHSPDPATQYRSGTVEHVLATIQDRWEQNPESQWELRRGVRQTIGQLHLTALHPDKEAVEEGASAPNRLSSAMLAEWAECRLLLGADVEHPDWSSIHREYPGLGAHTAMKYPHHGSKGAYHRDFAGGNGGALWVMTPYNRGHKLPRYEDGEGLDHALGAHEEIHLTGLPVRHELQGKRPYRTTRQALRDGKGPAPDGDTLPGGFTFSAKPQTDGLSCYVAAGFDDEGSLVDLQHGPGAVVVT